MKRITRPTDARRFYGRNFIA